MLTGRSSVVIIPLYTGGVRVSEPNSVRNSLLPVFSKYKLPVYFAGHEHDLQHLKPFDLSLNQFVSGAGSELRADRINVLHKILSVCSGLYVS